MVNSSARALYRWLVLTRTTGPLSAMFVSPTKKALQRKREFIELNHQGNLDKIFTIFSKFVLTKQDQTSVSNSPPMSHFPVIWKPRGVYFIFFLFLIHP
jgi:hypothetical protein